MEATRSSETSVEFQPITQHYVSEYSILHSHRWKNLKSNQLITYFILWIRRVPQGQHINMDSIAQQEVRRRVSKTQEKEKDVETRKQNTRVSSLFQ
jgi:hypothetical protein